MTTNIAIIDLDEVLCSSNELLLPIFNHCFNKNLSHHDWNVYDVCSLYDMTHDQYYELFDKFNVASNAPPCHGALEAVDILLSNGIVPVYVTARRPVQDTTPTLNWFKRYGLNADNLHIVGSANKATFVKHNYPRSKIIGVMDDNPHNIVHFDRANVGSNLFLIDTPCNTDFNHQQYPNVKRGESLLSSVIGIIQNDFTDKH